MWKMPFSMSWAVNCKRRRYWFLQKLYLSEWPIKWNLCDTRWLLQFNSWMKWRLQGFRMFFILNDERHFPYSHLHLYSRTFANKVLQRIQNAYTSISELQPINRQPSTYQSLGAKLKGAKRQRTARLQPPRLMKALRKAGGTPGHQLPHAYQSWP